MGPLACRLERGHTNSSPHRDRIASLAQLHRPAKPFPNTFNPRFLNGYFTFLTSTDDMEQKYRTCIGQNVNSFNVTNVTNVTDDRPRILTWISSLEPWKRHRDLSAARFGGVGDWVLETPEFQEWRDGDNGGSSKILLCCGIPGAGKTFIWYDGV